MSLESLYQRLPVPFQNIASSFEGWRIQRRRYGNDFQRLLMAAEARAGWSDDKIQAYRDQRLQDFIQTCAEHVPFYRDLFRTGGIDPSTIRHLDDLAALPTLDKATVQDRYGQLVSPAVPPRERLQTHTSGTTGGGLRFATTLAAMQEQWAVWWRYRHWHGLQPGTWCGYFGGRSVVPLKQTHPPFWRFNYPGRQILFSAYHLSPANLPAYLKGLRRYRPPWLHGYPSLLTLLAGFMLEAGCELGYPIRWITTGAENLLDHQIDQITRAFGVRPRQHYGMAEAIANISECGRGALHVDEDFAAVEFLPNPDGISHEWH